MIVEGQSYGIEVWWIQLRLNMTTFAFLSATSYLYFTFHGLDGSFCDASGSLRRHKKFKFAHFRDHLFHVLDVPKVKGAVVQTRNHCLQRCVKNPQCFSTNIAAFRRPDGNVSCNLLPTDRYRVPEMFRANHSFRHYSIVVSNFEL